MSVDVRIMVHCHRDEQDLLEITIPVIWFAVTDGELQGPMGFLNAEIPAQRPLSKR
jgi:hypothetical protein